jgi:hypothetical protein
MKTRCEQTEERLTGWLLGDLPAADAAAVEEHVRACPACQAVVDELRPALDLLRDTLQAQAVAEPALSPARREALRQAMQATAARPAARPIPVLAAWREALSWRWAPVLLRSAAALVILVGASVLLMYGTARQSASTSSVPVSDADQPVRVANLRVAPEPEAADALRHDREAPAVAAAPAALPAPQPPPAPVAAASELALARERAEPLALEPRRGEVKEQSAAAEKGGAGPAAPGLYWSEGPAPTATPAEAAVAEERTSLDEVGSKTELEKAYRYKGQSLAVGVGGAVADKPAAPAGQVAGSANGARDGYVERKLSTDKLRSQPEGPVGAELGLARDRADTRSAPTGSFALLRDDPWARVRRALLAGERPAAADVQALAEKKAETGAFGVAGGERAKQKASADFKADLVAQLREAAAGRPADFGQVIAGLRAQAEQAPNDTELAELLRLTEAARRAY